MKQLRSLFRICVATLTGTVVAAVPWTCGFGGSVSAQASSKADFRRDIQPLFKTYCVGCHGPTQQMNGFRLDRRRDAMRGGTLAVIGPGNSAGSRLYLRLIGNQYGLQMPPTGPLSPEQIGVIKAWIDQGAEWPDDLSGESPGPPPDPKAVQVMEWLRDGNRRTFQKILGEDPKVANLKGQGGSTPLMYAALYGDADCVRRLLESGADPNIHNEAGATALMWAVEDLEKSRLLLEHGADPNARSNAGRTPLLIAAGRFGSGPVVKLLLDHGANPSVKASGLFGEMTPLSEAAYAGDDAVVRLLIDRGADVKGAGFLPLTFALMMCANCVNLLIEDTSHEALNTAMLMAARRGVDGSPIKALLDHGADVNAKDPGGNSILMLAASSEALPVETIKSLIDRGSNLNAKNPANETALDFARRHGNTPIVALLTQSGAKANSTSPDSINTPKPAHSVQAAVDRSIPLLQRTDANFIQKSGCVSCHNNTLTAMTIATARGSGIPLDEKTAETQLKRIAAYIEGWRERALQGVGIPGDSDTISYILLGMAAENYPPDHATDALARFLKNHQASDGRWQIFAHRPPLESSDIEVTATSMHVIQVYAPKTQRAEYEKSVQRAASWLMNASPKTMEDRAFQLLGLQWAAADNEVIRKAACGLLSEQRPDGGWAQLPSLQSDAYATGQALVALKEAGALQVTDPAYKHGVQFLLNTQFEDGSWYVRSRAIPIQPHFENGFPHGHDQWVSAAATNWATRALVLAVR